MRRKWYVVSLLWLICLMWSGLESEAQEIESFIKQLGDEDESVRRNAVIALGSKWHRLNL